MNEERMFILKMIEQGKITAEEGAALLEALRDDGDRRAASDGGGPGADRDAGSGRDGRREPAADAGEGRGAEERDGERRTAGDARDDERHRRPRPADLATQIKEAIHSALRGVPHVTEELVENWKEVSEDVRNSFNEIRDEIRKRGLVDVSGLMELISHVRDLGFGHLHEFEEEVEGAFTEKGPRIELATTNGSITVRGWEKARYRLILRKRVQVADESRAEETARRLVDVTAEDGLLRATARQLLNSSVSMELWLPSASDASIELRSGNGGLRIEGLSCREASATTTNGSVQLKRVTADRVVTRTTNGKVSCSEVVSRSAEANTTNGSVSWSGAAESAEIRTVNGTARIEPQVPERPDGGDATEAGRSRYDVSSVNGSFHIDLPEDDGIGVSVVARGRSVKVEGDGLRLSFDGDGREERRARTPGYDAAPAKLDFVLSTVNGSVRFHTKSKDAGKDDRADEGEGGRPDAGRTDSDPENA